MSKRRLIYCDERFPDALIQLPHWPESKDAAEKMVQELALHPELGERVLDTVVCVARKSFILPNEKTVHLVLYFTTDEDEFSFTALWVDDEEHPARLPDLKTHRRPPSECGA